MVEKSEWSQLKMERQLRVTQAYGSTLDIPPCDYFDEHPPYMFEGFWREPVKLGRRASYQFRHPDGRLCFACQECADRIRGLV